MKEPALAVSTRSFFDATKDLLEVTKIPYPEETMEVTV